MEVRCALVKELPAIEREGGGSIVAALKPTAAFTLVDNPEVTPIAEDVEARMRRVLDTLG